jgi:NTE family protein
VKYDAVLEGGGVKIMGLVGAIAAIEGRGLTPSNMAGTSAGAIIAALRVAGYTASELKSIGLSLDFSQFKEGAPLGTKTYHFFANKGIYKTDEFYEWIKTKLAAKGVFTFKDLRTSEEDPRWRWKLKVIASDITESRMLVLPDDLVLFDMDPDDFEVAEAVRMSMSIPGFFRPARLKGNFIVDGGLLSNFPIWLFDSDHTPTWPTFGILLREPSQGKPNVVDGMISYMMAIFNTMLKAHDRRAISGHDYFQRVIQVPTGDVATTDFHLTAQKKEWLFHQGQVSGKDFLDNWSWPRYVAWAKQIRGIRD